MKTKIVFLLMILTTTIFGSEIYEVGSFVGVGATSPADKLHVTDGAITVKGVHTGQADSDWGSLGGQDVYSLIANRQQSGNAHALAGLGVVFDDGYESPVLYSYDNPGNKIVFGSLSSQGNRNLASDLKPLVVFNSDNGRVGIGTTEPKEELDVVGDLRLSGKWESSDGSDWTTRIYLEGLEGESYNTELINKRDNSNKFQIKVANLPVFHVGSSHALTLTSGWNSAGHMIFKPGGSEQVRFTGDGKVGIGTDSPEQKLHLKNGHLLLDNSSLLVKDSNGNQKIGLEINSENDFTVGWNHSNFRIGTNEKERFRIDETGRVGIGTSNPVEGYKLTVNGGIYALDMRIRPDLSNTADFVFEDDYELMSLSDVESSIKSNKHLPGIPSAKQMVKNGVSVSEMQANLLQKIEELTLYVIEQNKLNEAQNKKIMQLESQLN